MADTYSEIKALIVDLLGVDEGKVTMDARFREELEADSLDLVELIMAFEDKFGSEISDDDAQKITTVGEAVKYIIYADVKALIVKLLGVDADKIITEARLREDLEIKPEGLAKLIEALTEKFSIEFPDGDVQKFETIGEIVDYIDEHTSSV